MEFSVILAATEAAVATDRMFGLDSQLFWQVAAQIFNVALLAVFLTVLLYKPVRKALHKRTDRIQGQIEEAEREMAKANDLKQMYEQKMDEITREREEILSESRKIAAETSARLLAEARKEADSIKERAVSSVNLEWERAENEMRTAIIDVSAVMAEKFVSLAINKETHDRLFEETMSDLEGMSWRD